MAIYIGDTTRHAITTVYAGHKGNASRVNMGYCGVKGLSKPFFTVGGHKANAIVSARLYSDKPVIYSHFKDDIILYYNDSYTVNYGKLTDLNSELVGSALFSNGSGSPRTTYAAARLDDSTLLMLSSYYNSKGNLYSSNVYWNCYDDVLGTFTTESAPNWQDAIKPAHSSRPGQFFPLTHINGVYNRVDRRGDYNATDHGIILNNTDYSMTYITGTGADASSYHTNMWVECNTDGTLLTTSGTIHSGSSSASMQAKICVYAIAQNKISLLHAYYPFNIAENVYYYPTGIGYLSDSIVLIAFGLSDYEAPPYGTASSSQIYVLVDTTTGASKQLIEYSTGDTRHYSFGITDLGFGNIIKLVDNKITLSKTITDIASVSSVADIFPESNAIAVPNYSVSGKILSFPYRNGYIIANSTYWIYLELD